MVSGSAPLRQRAARRIWHGRGTFRSLDVRARTRAGNDSLPADVVSHAALEARIVSSAVIMRQSQIAILGAPLDLGAGRRGVDMGPSALRLAGLNAKLERLARRGGEGNDELAWVSAVGLGQCFGGATGEHAGGSAECEISCADFQELRE